MDIVSLQLASPDPRRLSVFYRDALGLPTTQVGPTAYEVLAGHSVLRIVLGPDALGSHHLALTISTEKFGAAKAWLAARTELLTREGRDEFDFEPPFGPARSLYFSDPDGSVLELIARPWPAWSRGAGFDPVEDIAGLGEVAVPVASVPVAVLQLGRAWSLAPVLDGGDFAAVGDERGMFILVSPQRAWFPTTDRMPNLTALLVEIAAAGQLAGDSVHFSHGTVATAARDRPTAPTGRAPQG